MPYKDTEKRKQVAREGMHKIRGVNKGLTNGDDVNPTGGDVNPYTVNPIMVKEVLGSDLCQRIELAHQFFVNLGVFNSDRTLAKRYDRAYEYHLSREA